MKPTFIPMHGKVGSELAVSWVVVGVDWSRSLIGDVDDAATLSQTKTA